MVQDMAHSVSGHLHVRVAEYDEVIRRLVPAYPAMRPVQLDLLALALPDAGAGRRVLDLGGGTGALAAAIAERFAAVTVEIWDTDPAMLAIAAKRPPSFAPIRFAINAPFEWPTTYSRLLSAFTSFSTWSSTEVRNETSSGAGLTPVRLIQPAFQP